jgi:hypothetical protein
VAINAHYPERFAQQALGYDSKVVHHAYSKHAEVTVPSLDDWEKQWKKNPQGIVKPAVVQVDFLASQASDATDDARVPAVSGGHGG